jgi:hypothetical protein
MSFTWVTPIAACHLLLRPKLILLRHDRHPPTVGTCRGETPTTTSVVTDRLPSKAEIACVLYAWQRDDEGISCLEHRSNRVTRHPSATGRHFTTCFFLNTFASANRFAVSGFLAPLWHLYPLMHRPPGGAVP